MVCSLKLIVILPFAPPPTSSTGGKGVARGDGRHFMLHSVFSVSHFSEAEKFGLFSHRYRFEVNACY